VCGWGRGERARGLIVSSPLTPLTPSPTPPLPTPPPLPPYPPLSHFPPLSPYPPPSTTAANCTIPPPCALSLSTVGDADLAREVLGGEGHNTLQGNFLKGFGKLRQ